MSLSVISEILGLFVNTLTTDGNYCLRDGEHFWQQIQMQLSKNKKTYYQLFDSFLKPKPNTEWFGKRYDLHSLCISEIIDCKRRG